MSSRRPPLAGRHVARTGAPLLTVNLVCAAIGTGIGFFPKIHVVTKRFHDL